MHYLLMLQLKAHMNKEQHLKTVEEECPEHLEISKEEELKVLSVGNLEEWLLNNYQVFILKLQVK